MENIGSEHFQCVAHYQPLHHQPSTFPDLLYPVLLLQNHIFILENNHSLKFIINLLENKKEFSPKHDHFVGLNAAGFWHQRFLDFCLDCNVSSCYFQLS